LDVIRQLRGWEVRGFEPSQYGAIGAQELGLNIVSDFARPNPDTSDLYDLVHCSEVIEHVFEPAKFVQLLASYLAPDGVLVLTTPNPDRVLPETPDAQLLPLLSPGAHTILFSADAVRRLLNDAGLAYVEVEPGSLSSLYYASRQPIEFQELEKWPEEYLAYLSQAANRAKAGSALEAGLRYRAFRAACDHAQFDQAERVLRPGMADPKPRLNSVNTIEQFAARWPLCIAASTYYVGMYLLLHKSRFAEAAHHFAAAHQLCRKKIELAPGSSVVEADLVWRAIYHKALAEKLNSDPRSAKDTLRMLSASSVAPPLPADLEPAIAALKTSIQ
jgi:SAM-dependent methyltransferase